MSKSQVAFIITSNGTANVYIDGRNYVVNRQHPHYKDVVSELHGAKNVDKLMSFINVPKAVARISNGAVTINQDKVYLNGQKITGKLVDRIVELFRQGYDTKYLSNFLAKLQNNPSYRSVNELFTFLEHQGFPITEDGCFLGYKSVRQDYLDHHSGKFMNNPGAVLTMPRNTVNEDARLACSSGFHVGTLEYARGFGGGNKRIMVVKVDPADVVSVPASNTNKLRTCKYEVLREHVDVDVHLNEGVYKADGSEFIQPNRQCVDEVNSDVTHIADLSTGDEFSFTNIAEEHGNVYQVVIVGKDSVVVKVVRTNGSISIGEELRLPLDMTHELTVEDEWTEMDDQDDDDEAYYDSEDDGYYNGW